MKRESSFNRVASFLGACAGLTAACVCVLLLAGEYHSARSKLDLHSKEVEEWEACRQANPSYYAASQQTASASRENLAEAQSNFWVKVPKTQFAGFLALGGLGSATAGYLGTWIVLLMMRLTFRGVFRRRKK